MRSNSRSGGVAVPGFCAIVDFDMQCPHCGSGLFEDADGLACFCGFHRYDNAKAQRFPRQRAPMRMRSHDRIGWWDALGTRPEVVIGKAQELSSAILSDGATPAELFVAAELVRLRLASEFHIELTPEQQKNLRGYLTHVLASS